MHILRYVTGLGGWGMLTFMLTCVTCTSYVTSLCWRWMNSKTKSLMEVTGRALKDRVAMWVGKKNRRVFRNNFPVIYRLSFKKTLHNPGEFWTNFGAWILYRFVFLEVIWGHRIPMSSSFEPLCIFMCSCACLRTPSVPAHTYVFLCISLRFPCIPMHSFTFSCILFLPFHLHMRLCISMFSFAFLYFPLHSYGARSGGRCFLRTPWQAGCRCQANALRHNRPWSKNAAIDDPCLKKLCQGIN